MVRTIQKFTLDERRNIYDGVDGFGEVNGFNRVLLVKRIVKTG